MVRRKLMTTRQLEANRANAKKSTGPRTPAGKSAIRFNALKSGVDAQTEVIPGENPAKLESLAAEYMARWNPRTPETRALVDICIRAEWVLGRMSRAEAALAVYKMERPLPTVQETLGRFIDYNDKVLDRLQRRANALQRNLQNAVKQLQALKDAEEACEPLGDCPPEALEAVPPQSLMPEIGFVPQLLRFPSPPPISEGQSAAETPLDHVGRTGAPAVSARPSPFLL
jgi:hypothetical protein